MRIAVLHPGAMGVTVGATLRASGHEVRWLAAGRSPATARRAAQANLETCVSAAALMQDLDAVVSVCPPGAALDMAVWVRDQGFQGIYVEANAVSPQTARTIADIVGSGFVDGGIIGPPARTPGTTRLYLSGSEASVAAAWFSAGPLQALVLDGGPGAASALKMAYAAYTKGLSALVLAVRALAEAEGIAPALLAEWALSQPGLTERSAQMARATAPKAWRFADEMHEIADAFAAAALPDGFHGAAAEIYRRLAPLKDAPDAALEDVLELLGRAEHPTQNT